MNKKLIGLCFLSCQLLIGCSTDIDEDIPLTNNICKGPSPFIEKLGFNPTNTAFSTSDKYTMGVLLVTEDKSSPTGIRQYQDSSWRMCGWAGPLQIDPSGNCFVAPVAMINVLNNSTNDQNKIYKIDALSGKMSEFIKLPTEDSGNAENVFGVLGLGYMCESNVLFATSVHGSTRKQEKGIIYAIDVASGSIIDELKGYDAMGVGVSYASGKRILYFGHARSSKVFGVELSSSGKFKGSPFEAFDITGIGPRGDDKVRKIKLLPDGGLQVYTIEFNFNLIAPTQKQEESFYYYWDETSEKWILRS